MANSDHAASATGEHQVVALKYRPQRFDSLIGQDHIAGALKKALEQNKVGQAYLFTGARGVGKTSSARIFAKCLNCKSKGGPTPDPCADHNRCDICQAISVGDDVDVLEIDGASNRGIDEIRTLRSNASVRPSRSRYKIYIIDEVHMLTGPAFNALLKTLEEPPAHVKFIFCTTDPQKIPITVLSRCQRFDFSPVQTGEIATSLKNIATNENVIVDDAALALLARRAGGSMRDSQSLLEQLLSFCETRITVDAVNQLLGTADVTRIAAIAEAIVKHNATETLNLINDAINSGVNAGQLAEQLLGYFRDAMAVKVGCGEDVLLTCTSAEMPSLTSTTESLGLETILSIIQIFDTAMVKMQHSLHARTLIEVAAMRVCNLENLDSISELVKQLGGEAGQKTSGKTSTASHGPQVVPGRSVELTKVSPINTTPAPKSDLKKNEIAKPESAPAADSQVPRLDAEKSVASMSEPVLVASVSADAEATSATQPSSERSFETERSAQNIAAAPSTSSKTALHATSTTATTSAAAPTQRPSNSSRPITETELKSMWDNTLAEIGDLTSDMAANYQSLKIKDGETLVVTLNDGYLAKECNRSERKQKFEELLAATAGRRFRLEFVVSQNALESTEPAQPQLSRVQRIRKLHEHEFIKQASDLFDAQVVNFFEPRSSK